MRTILAAAAMTMLSLGCSTARAAPPDTSSMPQLDLPQATPPEPAVAGPVFAFTATAASDYVFRGISQTENGAAVFGSGRVSYDNVYAGVGMENVNFHNSTTAEYDLSAGWTPVVDGFRFDLGVVRYGYIDQPAHTEIDTAEVKAVVLHDFGPVTLGGAVYYSGNYFGSHRDDVYGEGRVTYRITPKLRISGAAGRQSGGLSDHDLERRRNLCLHQAPRARPALCRYRRTRSRQDIRQPFYSFARGGVLIGRAAKRSNANKPALD